MRKLFLFLCLPLFSASGFSLDEGNSKLAGWQLAALLPTSAQQVIIYDYALKDERVGRIVQRFKQAMAQEPDFFFEWSKKRKSSGHLPYTPRMGISRKEYELFLKNANAEGLKLKPVGTGELAMIKGAENWKILFATRGQELSEFSIDARTFALNLEGWGSILNPKPFSALKAPGGHTEGFAWNFSRYGNLSSLSEMDATSISVTIGRLMNESNQCIIKIDAKTIKDRNIQKRVYKIAKYDC